MGQCCYNPEINKGEAFLNKIVLDKTLILNSLTYTEMKQILESKKQHLNNKNELLKILSPLLYENGSESDSIPYFVYHQAMIHEIFSKIKMKTTVNEVLFWLYPYMNQSNDNVGEVLYELFYNLASDTSSEFNQYEVHDILTKYIDNATQMLTFSIWGALPKGELKESFDEMNTTVYTIDHLNKMTNRIMNDFERKGDKSRVIPQEEFIDIMKRWDIGYYLKIRMFLYNEYEAK